MTAIYILTVNHWVAGSITAGGANKFPIFHTYRNLFPKQRFAIPILVLRMCYLECPLFITFFTPEHRSCLIFTWGSTGREVPRSAVQFTDSFSLRRSSGSDFLPLNMAEMILPPFRISIVTTAITWIRINARSA